MNRRKQVECIEARIDKLDIASEFQGTRDQLVESVKACLVKISPLTGHHAESVRNCFEVRAFCAIIAKHFIVAAEMTLDVTLRHIRRFLLDYAAKNPDDTVESMSTKSSVILKGKAEEFGLVRSRYLYCFTLLEFICEFDSLLSQHKYAEDAVDDADALMSRMLTKLNSQTRSEDGITNFFDPSGIDEADGNLYEMTRMIFVLQDGVAEYQRCFVLLSAWVILPSSFNIKDDVSKKALYFILAWYVVRVSRLLCDPETCPNEKLRAELNASSAQWQVTAGMLSMVDRYLTEFRMDRVYSSFNDLRPCVFDIAVILHPEPDSIVSGGTPGQRLKSNFESVSGSRDYSLNAVVFGGWYLDKGKKLAALVPGLITDVVAFFVLLGYRAFDGAEEVTFLGRTYEDSRTVFGKYEGRWYLFKGHNDLTWRQWFFDLRC
jgi:hypothetical protein